MQNETYNGVNSPTPPQNKTDPRKMKLYLAFGAALLAVVVFLVVLIYTVFYKPEPVVEQTPTQISKEAKQIAVLKKLSDSLNRDAETIKKEVDMINKLNKLSDELSKK